MTEPGRERIKGDYEIPLEHVLMWSLIEQTEDSPAFHLMVLDTWDYLNELFGVVEYPIDAVTLMYDQPDSLGSIATVVFVPDAIDIATIAHESAHLALYHYSNELADEDEPVYDWLIDHPESIVRTIGEVTALICYALEENFNE